MDQSMMDSMMNHSSMHMGMAPSPAPMMDHSAMNHSAMNQSMMDHSAMDHSMMPHSSPMMMMMWFQATKLATLWFKSWNTDTDGKYAASIIGLFILCLFQEAIFRLRTHLSGWAAACCYRRRAGDPENLSSGHPEIPSTVAIARFGEHPFTLRLLLTFLYAVNLTSSYLLMLAIMTYNLGYFLTIVLGLALGHLFFLKVESASADMSESCCAAPCCANNRYADATVLSPVMPDKVPHCCKH